MSKIIIFTLPTCPKCRVIKTKLESAGIEYEECQDVDRMRSLGIETTPALYISPENRIFRSFGVINTYVNDLIEYEKQRRSQST